MGRFVESGDQGQQGGLAGAGRADDGDRAARRDGEGQALECLSSSVRFCSRSIFRGLRLGFIEHSEGRLRDVLKGDLLEADGTLDGSDSSWRALGARLSWRVEQFADPLGGGTGVLEDVGDLSDHADPPAEGHLIHQHFRQIAQ